MKRYKITLKPLEPYFFGGDLTFGKVGSKTNGSYIAKSTYFPQQSAFLGLLRKEIVECLQDYEKAKQTVGGSKFFIKSKDDTKLDFGAIRDITPLFVQQSKELFLPLQDVFAYKITKENNNFLVGGFEPKKGVLTKLFSITSDTKLSLDKVFEEKTMVGNSKKEKDNAFFKKIAIQMSECCSFVYFVEFDICWRGFYYFRVMKGMTFYTCFIVVVTQTVKAFSQSKSYVQYSTHLFMVNCPTQIEQSCTLSINRFIFSMFYQRVFKVRRIFYT